MKLPSKIKFCNERVKEVFLSLEKGPSGERKLYTWLVKAFEAIEKYAFSGIQVPKRLIPREYITRYCIHNLWKYNLPNAWRLLYSVEEQEIIVVSIVLEWLPHKEYERRFNY